MATAAFRGAWRTWRTTCGAGRYRLPPRCRARELRALPRCCTAGAGRRARHTFAWLRTRLRAAAHFRRHGFLPAGWRTLCAVLVCIAWTKRPRSSFVVRELDGTNRFGYKSFVYLNANDGSWNNARAGDAVTVPAAAAPFICWRTRFLPCFAGCY